MFGSTSTQIHRHTTPRVLDVTHLVDLVTWHPSLMACRTSSMGMCTCGD